jgi:membrane associated rhomboid family serine protease
MVGLIVFGSFVEKTYGTMFYAVLHLILMIISNVISLGFYTIMTFFVEVGYRGGPDNFFHCSIGYSNILFGLAMVYAYNGNP